MGNYVEGSLLPGEQVAYTAKVSLWSLLPLILIGLLTITFLVGILFLLAAAIRYYTTELAITNKRIIAKFGFISRSTIELNLNKAESIQVNQGILGRIFDFGSIIVSGAGAPQAPVPGISQPLEFRRAFLSTQEQIAHPDMRQTTPTRSPAGANGIDKFCSGCGNKLLIAARFCNSCGAPA